MTKRLIFSLSLSDTHRHSYQMLACTFTLYSYIPLSYARMFFMRMLVYAFTFCPIRLFAFARQGNEFKPWNDEFTAWDDEFKVWNDDFTPWNDKDCWEMVKYV